MDDVLSVVLVHETAEILLQWLAVCDVKSRHDELGVAVVIVHHPAFAIPLSRWTRGDLRIRFHPATSPVVQQLKRWMQPDPVPECAGGGGAKLGKARKRLPIFRSDNVDCWHGRPDLSWRTLKRHRLQIIRSDPAGSFRKSFGLARSSCGSILCGCRCLWRATLPRWARP